MRISQQIVGVNQRLGNTAVPNMQGTTRYIYDSQPLTNSATRQTVTLFQGTSNRLFPLSNINNNRFEPGESLAVTGITWFSRLETVTTLADVLRPALQTANNFTNTLSLNLFIGNQRVIKDLDLNYARFMIGESRNPGVINSVFHLETPIVIPPQIEFYATLTISNTSAIIADSRIYLGLFGQGTLLNTKENY
jgi:hypothetical protein